MPTSAAGIAREHLEASLAALSDRVSPATVAKHYRSLQQLFNTFANRRDTAMLQMLIDTGMRAGEAGLDVDDLDSEQGVAVVMGKGRRGRPVPQTRRATHPSTSRYELFTRSPPPIHSGRAPPAA